MLFVREILFYFSQFFVFAHNDILNMIATGEQLYNTSGIFFIQLKYVSDVWSFSIISTNIVSTTNNKWDTSGLN